MQSELCMLRINEKQLQTRHRRWRLDLSTIDLKQFAFLKHREKMCSMAYSVLFGNELSTHTSENHTALKGFAISKNMHLEVKYDLQFEKSDISCPSSEIGKIKNLSSCMKKN